MRTLPLTIFLLFLLASTEPASAVSKSEVDKDRTTTTRRPPFPSHWGHPPLRQTRDLVDLPGEYGRGSGTLKKWILSKMAEDQAVAPGSGSTWPEISLVGLTGEEAKRIILSTDSSLDGNIHILPHDAMVTMDYREDRVRIFVDDNGKVARQPKRG